ncbi:MAG: DUF4157 domain-containing protein [Pseudomonadota bacterium]
MKTFARLKRRRAAPVVRRRAEPKRGAARAEPGMRALLNEPAAKADVSQTVATGTSSGGTALPGSARHYFEPRFGQDLGQVRVHTDAAAAASARSLGARAYTFGRDIAFGAGEYDPDAAAGRRLLAHELTHVVQQDRSEEGVVRRAPQAEKADAAASRAEYLAKVEAAIAQLGDKALGADTLSDLLFALFKALGKAGKVTWRDSAGTQSGGGTIDFQPPGKGAKKLKLRLVLDEADPAKEKREGFFSASEGKIVLFVNQNTSVDDIRDTLVHEGLHLAAHILQAQGASSLGGPKDVAVKALQEDLGLAQPVESLRKHLTALNGKLNLRRAEHGDPAVGADTIDNAAKELWEEATVRAETFYIELSRWLGSGDKSAQPSPKYLTAKMLKETYLKTFSVLTDADVSGMTKDEEELVAMISTYLMYQQRLLIKRRGVINAYVPHPLEPRPIFLQVPRQDPRPEIGPMLRDEDLAPDMLKRIEEDAPKVPD